MVSKKPIFHPVFPQKMLFGVAKQGVGVAKMPLGVANFKSHKFIKYIILLI